MIRRLTVQHLTVIACNMHFWSSNLAVGDDEHVAEFFSRNKFWSGKCPVCGSEYLLAHIGLFERFKKLCLGIPRWDIHGWESWRAYAFSDDAHSDQVGLW